MPFGHYGYDQIEQDMKNKRKILFQIHILFWDLSKTFVSKTNFDVTFNKVKKLTIASKIMGFIISMHYAPGEGHRWFGEVQAL